MALSPENKKKLLETTREPAIALVEDVEHLRQFAGRQDPTPAELRRLSGILRRLLVERDLSNVAAPRIGKILLNAPDNKAFYKANNNYVFFASGGADAFGATFRGISISAGASSRTQGAPPDRMVQLSLDGFLSQHVLCLKGQWASRNAVVKYVANVTSGVHSKTPNKEDEKLLSRIRSVVSYEPTTTFPRISIGFDAINTETVEFTYSPAKLDPVLLELLATIQFIVASPDVHKLEAAIAAEHTRRI
jgi:hypothetical protein